MLPVVWLGFVLLGYTAIFWGLGLHPLRRAFVTSGSSLLTLGFATVPDLPSTVAAFSEALVGLILLALLITYLPSMYAAFSRREAMVAMNAIQAGAPPSAEMLERFHVLSHLDLLDEEVWRPWTGWFVEVEETHTSLAALSFFRSPRPERSWITAPASCATGPPSRQAPSTSPAHRRPSCARGPGTFRCGGSPISTGSPTTPTQRRTAPSPSPPRSSTPSAPG